MQSNVKPEFKFYPWFSDLDFTCFSKWNKLFSRNCSYFFVIKDINIYFKCQLMQTQTKIFFYRWVIFCNKSLPYYQNVMGSSAGVTKTPPSYVLFFSRMSSLSFTKTQPELDKKWHELRKWGSSLLPKHYGSEKKVKISAAGADFFNLISTN